MRAMNSIKQAPSGNHKLEMRVAISGTHCCGKSTLIDEFLTVHPDFSHEPEPYEVLQEEYGESFGAEVLADDFDRQLAYNVKRLLRYRSGDKVIFERSPVDFVAYMVALAELGRDSDGTRLAVNSLEIARRGMLQLDLVVFLRAEFEAPDSEDAELRAAMEAHLESLLIDEKFDLIPPAGLKIVEAFGTTAQRLHLLESAIAR